MDMVTETLCLLMTSLFALLCFSFAMHLSSAWYWLDLMCRYCSQYPHLLPCSDLVFDEGLHEWPDIDAQTLLQLVRAWLMAYCNCLQRVFAWDMSVLACGKQCCLAL